MWLVKHLKERDENCDEECSNEMTTERDDNPLRPHSEKGFKMGAGMLLRRTLNMKYIKDPRKVSVHSFKFKFLNVLI